MKAIYAMYEKIAVKFGVMHNEEMVLEAYLSGPGGAVYARLRDCDEQAMTPVCLGTMKGFIGGYLEALEKHS